MPAAPINRATACAHVEASYYSNVEFSVRNREETCARDTDRGLRDEGCPIAQLRAGRGVDVPGAERLTHTWNIYYKTPSV
jgi:hypothetical protein